MHYQSAKHVVKTLQLVGMIQIRREILLDQLRVKRNVIETA